MRWWVVLVSTLWARSRLRRALQQPPFRNRQTARIPSNHIFPARVTLNQYFKLTFELPPVSDLHAIPEPAARDGSVQILELASPPPGGRRNLDLRRPLGEGKNQDAKAFLREALDQELYRGVEELRGLSKVMLSGHQFYLFETRRGIEQHMLLATTLDGYIVQVVLAAHDEKVLKQLESSFEHLVFFAPSELKQ